MHVVHECDWYLVVKFRTQFLLSTPELFRLVASFAVRKASETSSGHLWLALSQTSSPYLLLLSTARMWGGSWLPTPKRRARLVQTTLTPHMSPTGDQILARRPSRKQLWPLELTTSSWFQLRLLSIFTLQMLGENVILPCECCFSVYLMPFVPCFLGK